MATDSAAADNVGNMARKASRALSDLADALELLAAANLQRGPGSNNPNVALRALVRRTNVLEMIENVERFGVDEE